MSHVYYSQIDSEGPFSLHIERGTYAYMVFNPDNGVNMVLERLSETQIRAFSKLGIIAVFIDEKAYNEPKLKAPMISEAEAVDGVEDLKSIGVEHIHVHEVIQEGKPIGTIVIGFSRMPNIGDTFERFKAIGKLTQNELVV